MVRTYRLYASLGVTTNAAAFVDIKRKGKIIGVLCAVLTSSAPATGDYFRPEISFSSTGQTAVNDANGIIAEFAYSGFLATSGAGIFDGATYLGPLAVPVNIGDRIYLHCLEAGTQTWITGVLLYVDE